MSSRPSRRANSGRSLTRTADSAPSREVIGYAPHQARTPTSRSARSRTRSRSAMSGLSRTGASQSGSLPTRSNNTHWQTKMALASTVPGSRSASKFSVSKTASKSGVSMSGFSLNHSANPSEFKTYVPGDKTPSFRTASHTMRSAAPGLESATRTKSWMGSKSGQGTRTWNPVSRASGMSASGMSASGTGMSYMTATGLRSGYDLEDGQQDKKKGCNPLICVLITVVVLFVLAGLMYIGLSGNATEEPVSRVEEPQPNTVNVQIQTGYKPTPCAQTTHTGYCCYKHSINQMIDATPDLKGFPSCKGNKADLKQKFAAMFDKITQLEQKYGVKPKEISIRLFRPELRDEEYIKKHVVPMKYPVRDINALHYACRAGFKGVGSLKVWERLLLAPMPKLASAENAGKITTAYIKGIHCIFYFGQDGSKSDESGEHASHAAGSCPLRKGTGKKTIKYNDGMECQRTAIGWRHAVYVHKAGQLPKRN